jgi:hypothetical protein
MPLMKVEPKPTESPKKGILWQYFTPFVLMSVSHKTAN